MTVTYRKKLIEVALPLAAINKLAAAPAPETEKGQLGLGLDVIEELAKRGRPSRAKKVRT